MLLVHITAVIMKMLVFAVLFWYHLLVSTVQQDLLGVQMRERDNLKCVTMDSGVLSVMTCLVKLMLT